MWFGSYNGLHKNEGTSIKVYNKSHKNPNSLSSQEIHPVFEDRLGFIWAGTTNGLDKLNPATNEISHYKVINGMGKDENIGYIYSIFQDRDDNIWIATDAGIFIIDYATGANRHIPDNEKSPKGLPENRVGYKGTYAVKDGIWIVANCRLVFYDYKTRQFFHRFNNPDKRTIFNVGGTNNIYASSDLCLDSLNNVYFIAKDSLLIRYNLATEKIDSFSFHLPRNSWNCCFSLTADYRGNIWIGFRFGGLLYFNQGTHQFTSIRNEDVNSLVQSDYVYSLCEDYLKRMWVTTNNGIFVINYYDSSVQEKYLSGKKEFVNLNYTAALISQDDKGNIYIPFGAGGLFRYNVFTGNNRYFPATNNLVNSFGYIFNGKGGRINIGSGATLIPSDTLLRPIQPDATTRKIYKLLGLFPAKVSWVFEYGRNAIYFKKTDGTIYYYDGTDSLKRIRSTGYARQACISPDSSYLFFLNDNGDIIRRNLVTLAMDTISLYNKLQALHFSFATPRDIAQDDNGNIWLTSQNGLIRYNLKNETVSIYTTADGLLHDFSIALCFDSKKRLWVSSMGGVNLYDPKKDAFINVFPESPDQQSNYFGSGLEGKDGHIYFLSGGKLININSDTFIQQEAGERLLQLNEIQVNGKAVNVSGDVLTHLTYLQNRIYFRFGLLEFTEPEKVTYYYKLQANDKEWVDLGNHSEVTFNSLQPGRYILHVKATGVTGYPAKAMLSIPFDIKFPFWQTWVFRLCVVLCIAFCLYQVVKWREKKIKDLESGKTRLQQLTAEKYKSQFESEQISTFFTNSLFNKNDIDDVLWDVAKNLIGKLNFVDCIIYLWNDDKTKMIQKAGYGPKGSLEDLEKNHFDVLPGQGVVGAVILSGESLIIPDTTIDQRYRVDDVKRMSELCVPIKYNEQLLGVIDSEHYEKNFFTRQHLQVLTTIATLIASKIKSIESEQRLRHQKAELADINQQLAEVQLAALRSQMNPHFIFNALNSIKKFVIANEPANAEKYLGKFSRLIRSILDNSRGGMVTIEKELHLLKLYLDLEQLRFGTKLSYSIVVDKAIRPGEIEIPSMIVQPFVENAMLHGIMHREDGGKIDICFILYTRWLQITIEDNGVGRSKSASYKSEHDEPHHSVGIQVATRRLEALRKSETTPAGITIVDLVDDNGVGSGTRVVISIPVD